MTMVSSHYLPGHVWLDGAGNDDAIREITMSGYQPGWYSFRKQGVILTPPEGIMHFRDPKVWREADTRWMVVGAKDRATQDRSCFIAAVHCVNGLSIAYWPTLMRVKAICGNVRTFQPWRSTLSDVFPAGNVMPRDTVIEIAFQSGVIPGIWSPGRLFAQSGHFLLNLITGMTFYAPQSF